MRAVDSEQGSIKKRIESIFIFLIAVPQAARSNCHAPWQTVG